MLNDIQPEKENELELRAQNTHVFIDVGGDIPMSLELPPVEEIMRIGEIKFTLSASVDLLPEYNAFVRSVFGAEYARRLKKIEKYSKSPTYFNRLASISELAGNIDVAIQHSRHAASLSDDVFLMQKSGVFLVKGNKVAEAKKLFSSRELSSDTNSSFYLSLLLIKENQFTEARKVINQALDIDPLNARARLISGVLFLLARDFRKSIAEFRVASEDRPKDPALYHNMAVAYLYLGQEGRALEAIKKAYTLNSLSRDSAELYADLLIRSGQFGVAKDILRHFLRFDSTAKSIHERLALAHFRSDEYAECIEALKREASLSDSSNVWNNIAVAYLKNEEKDRALQYYAHALKRMLEEPKINYTLVTNFINALNSQKRYDEALAIAKPVLNDRSVDEIASSVELSAVFVNSLVSLSEKDHDLVDINLINAMLENAHLPVQSRACLLIYATFYYSSVRRNEEMALKYASAIERLCQEDVELSADTRALLVNNMIFAFLDFDKLVEAEKWMPKLLPLVHYRAAPTATFGLFLFKKASVTRAQSFYRKAISLTPNRDFKERIRAKLALETAKVYLLSGEQKKAKSYLDKAVKHNDKNWFVRLVNNTELKKIK